MPSRNAAIAEAVKVALNAAAAADAFGERFVAKRVYSPVSALKDQKDWHVTVYAPGESTEDAITRVQWGLEVPVIVGLEKRIRGIDPTAEDDNATLDGMTALAEAVADFFSPRFRAAGRSLKRRATALPNGDVVRSQRRFLALITLYFLDAT